MQTRNQHKRKQKGGSVVEGLPTGANTPAD